MGDVLCVMLSMVINLCLYRLFSKVSHLVSSSNFNFEQDFVAPVTIRIASV